MTEFVRKRLAELITASGIPPSRLSEMLYLNPGYFSDVRRGKQIVSYDVLAKVCDYCNIPLNRSNKLPRLAGQWIVVCCPAGWLNQKKDRSIVKTGGEELKDDRICEYCTYKNVPTKFSPCLGCAGNMDHLIQERKESGNEQVNISD